MYLEENPKLLAFSLTGWHSWPSPYMPCLISFHLYCLCSLLFLMRQPFAVIILSGISENYDPERLPFWIGQRCNCNVTAHFVQPLLTNVNKLKCHYMIEWFIFIIYNIIQTKFHHLFTIQCRYIIIYPTWTSIEMESLKAKKLSLNKAQCKIGSNWKELAWNQLKIDILTLKLSLKKLVFEFDLSQF